MQALALVETPDHVCCRYRIRPFLPALERAHCDVDIAGLERQPFARAGQLARAARPDVVLLQRKLLSGWQWALLRRQARRLVFDFDDAVFLRDSYDPRGPNCPRRARRFARIAREADLLIAGNAFLAEAAIEAGASPSRVRVIPTCVEPSAYPVAFDRPRTEGLDLTWIGSSSTLRGIESKADLWRRVGRSVPSARFRVICDRFPRFDPLPVVDVAWAEQTEGAELARGDVGVAWVPDDPWSRGKCGLKVLQYQAAGLAVIANPVGVQARMVEPSRNGWLVEDDDSWVAAVREAAGSPDLCEAMGRAGRASVEASYSVEGWSGEFVGALTGRPASVAGRPLAAASRAS
ncbi:glycosyltransferase family 4 protein [Isosphaeraceae bacterium EP7]